MKVVEEGFYKHIARMDRIINYYYLKIKNSDKDNKIIETIDKYNNFKQLYFYPKKGESQVVSKNSLKESMQVLQNEISQEILIYLINTKK